MQSSLKFLSTLLISLALVGGVSACSEGPAEEAGASIDEAVDNAKNSVEDACEQAKSEMGMKEQDC